MSWLSREDNNKKVDTLNKLFQIVGIILAGLWAIWTFTQNVMPTLERRGAGSLEMEWSDGPSSETCAGTLHVSLKNEGTKAFGIESVRIKGWIYEVGAPDSKKPTVSNPLPVDYERIVSKTPNFEESNTPLLTGHYSTGVGRDESFSWQFLRSPSKNVRFIVEFKTKDGESYIPQEDRAFSYCPESATER